MPSVWFITGVGRGIGLGLVKSLLLRPQITVIGTTRDGKLTPALADAPRAEGSKLIILPLEVGNKTSASEAIAKLQTEHHVDHIDVLWANAGVADEHLKLTDLPLEGLERDFSINTVGPMRLLQASLSLLRAAKEPKFVVTTSAIGSVELASKLTFASAAYGASKAAINYLARRLNEQEKDLIVVAIHPGLVQTDMGNSIIERTTRPNITVDESVKGVLGVVDKATKQSDDRLLVYDGTQFPW